MAAAAANLLVANPPCGEILEIEDQVDKNFRSFANFDVVTYPPLDHHFINAPSGGVGHYIPCTTRRLKSVRENKIKNDWELLKTNLPNSIFVRTYTERIDLMRVAIIGLGGGGESHQGLDGDVNDMAAINPYGYGLFFFDVYFPPQYPEKPPSVSHIFLGMSLLGQQNNNKMFVFKGGGGGGGNGSRLLTSLCFGSDIEDKWDPQRSNFLQVLGFIQGQVLRPRNISDYWFDDMFLMSHKSMKWTLVYPPLGFEALVRGYFRKFSNQILVQFKELLEKKERLLKNKNGGGSVVSMGWLTFAVLLEAFKNNGSYCQHFVLLM